jgi:hypothetical protein
MQFELAGLEPLPDAFKHVFCLTPALAVKHRIVGVSGIPNARQISCHPQIKRVMQKQICQERRNHALNAKGNFRFEREIRHWRSGNVLDLRRKE